VDSSGGDGVMRLGYEPLSWPWSVGTLYSTGEYLPYALFYTKGDAERFFENAVVSEHDVIRGPETE